MDDVITNKISKIQNCVRRVVEEYRDHEAELETNYTKQDSIILNLQRACEAAIDLGARIVRLKKLGVPQSNREMFQMLHEANILSEEVSHNLQNMVGFRNIAIHDYDKVNLQIVRSIIENNLPHFDQFIEEVSKLPF